MNPETPEALQVLLSVVEIMDRLEVDYHVGGSYASSVHGVPRQTQDIDLVVNLSLSRMTDLVVALEQDYFVQESSVRDAVKHRRSFNAVHLATGLKVDFFVKGDEPFDNEEFARARAETLVEGHDVLIKSPEDIILRKLQWYRAGGDVSDRQFSDAVGILRTQGQRLDFGYLDRWAALLGVSDLLKRAMDS